MKSRDKMKFKQFRDLSLMQINKEQMLVIACDSAAGIGHKVADKQKVDPAITAAFCVRVPLLELMCFGAQPLMVIDTIGNELTPTGERIIAGVKSELAKAQLADLPLNGSTEENIITAMTSMGITIVGMIDPQEITQPLTDSLTVFKYGQSFIGEGVAENIDNIFSYDLIRELKHNQAVRDILPVGSKGASFEVQQMAQTHQLHPEFIVDPKSDEMTVTGGPSTIMVVGVLTNQATDFQTQYPDFKRVAILN